MERRSLIQYLHNDVSDPDIMVSGWVRKLIPVMIWGESGYDKKCVILNHEWTIRVGIIVESCGYVVIGRALKNETFWLLTLQIGWVELKLWLSEVYSSVITEMEEEFFLGLFQSQHLLSYLKF